MMVRTGFQRQISEHRLIQIEKKRLPIITIWLTWDGLKQPSLNICRLARLLENSCLIAYAEYAPLLLAYNRN